MAQHEPARATSVAADSGQRFRFALLALVVLGALVRIGFAVAVAPDLPLPGDAKLYREMAGNLAAGRGLSTVGVDIPDLQPSAEHPPLFPGVLAALDRVGLADLREQRVSLAVVSAASVLLVGLLGRRLGGPAVGLVAGAIAALHPLWLQSAGLVMSESLHLVFVPAVLLVGLSVLERPSYRGAAALGGLIGAAALVRPEALGLAVVVGVPALLPARAPWPVRARLCAVLMASCLLVITPWLVRNQRELGAVTMSTNAGKTLLGSNCDASYSGSGLGGFAYDCQFGAATVLVDYGPPDGGRWDGVSFDRALGAVGRDFIDTHREQLPRVILARSLRMWGLAFAEDQLQFDVLEGRDATLQRVGQWVHLALVPPAIAGAVILARRTRRRAVLLLGPPALVTLTVVLIYGGTRMRVGAEPSIAVLSAIGLVSVGRWLEGRRGDEEPPRSRRRRAPAVACPAYDQDRDPRRRLQRGQHPGADYGSHPT